MLTKWREALRDWPYRIRQVPGTAEVGRDWRWGLVAATFLVSNIEIRSSAVQPVISPPPIPVGSYWMPKYVARFLLILYMCNISRHLRLL